MQIDPVELAKEIALNIPEPQPGFETYIFGLFALSGWIVAGFVVWYLMKRDKREEEKKTDENHLWERIITALTEARVTMEGIRSDDGERRNVLTGIKQDIETIKQKVV